MNKGENILGQKIAMCKVCGNTCDKCFEVRMGGETHVQQVSGPETSEPTENR